MARYMFELAWELATRAGVPMAVGGDFNHDLKPRPRLVVPVPDGAVFDEVDYVPSAHRAQKNKIDWLFLLAPPGCKHRLRLCTKVEVLDPAAPHRRVSGKKVHPEFFDHDAICVGLALAVRWESGPKAEEAAKAAVRIQAAARGHAARSRAQESKRKDIEKALTSQPENKTRAAADGTNDGVSSLQDQFDAVGSPAAAYLC
jgi:hypothetical protein